MNQQTITLIGCVLLIIAGCGQPSNTALMESGDYARWQGRWEDAATDYNKAVSQHPGDWRAQHHLGQCLLELDDPLGASQALAIAESIQPCNEEIAELLAEALLRSGDRNRLFSFLRTRAQKHQTVRDWIQFAQYAMDLDDPDAATNAINTAIAISDRSDSTPYVVAAQFAERLGDDTLAISMWQQAWRIEPKNETIADALRTHGEIPGPTMTGITDDPQ